MLNVSQEERLAKQLLPKVLEEKSATKFTASSPGAQMLSVANGTGDEKQTETSILRHVVLFPISESRAKTQLEHSRYLKNMGFACLEIIACCNVPGIHDAVWAQARWNCVHLVTHSWLQSLKTQGLTNYGLKFKCGPCHYL